jgi:rsbT co-antagonist protein RsbR
MGVARSRAGLSNTQVSSELAALRPPVENLLAADLEQAPPEHLRACSTALTVLMGTLRLVAMQTALLIGTLDSARSQIVMETLLNAVVEQHARFAILDITGVPTVDSLVAQHLMKTVAAARLMGAQCIVSGIRPAIAQTIVHLGLDLDVITRASLADALGYALHQLGADIVNPGAGQR